jgi:hypothetical protein
MRFPKKSEYGANVILNPAHGRTSNNLDELQNHETNPGWQKMGFSETLHELLCSLHTNFSQAVEAFLPLRQSSRRSFKQF